AQQAQRARLGHGKLRFGLPFSRLTVHEDREPKADVAQTDAREGTVVEIGEVVAKRCEDRVLKNRRLRKRQRELVGLPQYHLLARSQLTYQRTIWISRI